MTTGAVGSSLSQVKRNVAKYESIDHMQSYTHDNWGHGVFLGGEQPSYDGEGA